MYNKIGIKTEHGDHEILLDEKFHDYIRSFGKCQFRIIYLQSTPYVQIELLDQQERIMLHTAVGYYYITGSDVVENGEAFYHANGDTFDNRSENIVLGKVKFKGASWDRRAGKWRSQIWLNGKVVHLGHFKTPEEASMEYYKYRDEHKDQRRYVTK